jgi:hypothetical protein
MYKICSPAMWGPQSGRTLRLIFQTRLKCFGSALLSAFLFHGCKMQLINLAEMTAKESRFGGRGH